MRKWISALPVKGYGNPRVMKCGLYRSAAKTMESLYKWPRQHIRRSTSSYYLHLIANLKSHGTTDANKQRQDCRVCNFRTQAPATTIFDEMRRDAEFTEVVDLRLVCQDCTLRATFFCKLLWKRAKSIS